MRNNYLRLFRIFGYCIAGYWLLLVCPLSLRSVVYEGGLDLMSALLLACYCFGVPTVIIMVSHFFARPALYWRVVEGLVLLAIIALVLPMFIEFSRAPVDNVDLLFALSPLSLYLLVLLGAMLLRGRPSKKAASENGK